jgi:tetratricopeptide (TPR) repeat protein
MWQTVQNSAAWWSNYSYWKNCTENLPDNLVCRFKLAIEHQDNDRIKQMLQEYKKMLQYSVKYNPIRDFNPAFQLGRKYRDIGDVENACYYFNNALNVNRLNPNMRKSARSYCQKNCEKYMPKAHRK